MWCVDVVRGSEVAILGLWASIGVEASSRGFPGMLSDRSISLPLFPFATALMLHHTCLDIFANICLSSIF